MKRPAPHSTQALARFRHAGWPARLAALTGILAVLLQGALPIAHPARMTTSDPRYADYLVAFGAAAGLALCQVDAAAPGADNPGKPGSARHLPSCPICLAALQAASFLPPDGVAAPLPTQAAGTVTTATYVAARRVAAAAAAQPRAPPLPV